MKVYESETAGADGPSANGTGPEAPEDDWAGEEEERDFSNLFDAPAYASFIKTKPNSKAKSYEARTASMMRALMLASLNNQQYPDAATFLKYGPGFSKAAGNLAAEDARVAGIIEMLTAPDSPYVMFALCAVPMISQLFRNHQAEVAEAAANVKKTRAEKKRARQAGVQPPKQPPITVHIFRREVKLPIRVKFRMPKLQGALKAFMGTTQHPSHIAAEVFNDPAVVRAIHEMGLIPRQPEGQSEPQA